MSFAIFTQCFVTIDLCVVCLHFNQCLLLFVCMFDLGIRTIKHAHMETHSDIPKELGTKLRFLIWLGSVWFGFTQCFVILVGCVTFQIIMAVFEARTKN